MGFIARNLKNPARSFSYIPLELKGFDRLVIKLDPKSKRNPDFGTPYEFLLNFNGRAYKVVGIPEKKILDKVFVKITSQEEANHRFPKLDISDLNIKVDLLPDPETKLRGKVLDFSLGGSHIKLLDEDYKKAKELFGKNPVWEAIFHLERESVRIWGVPYSFKDEDKTILFVFSHNPNNYVIVDLYEELLRRKERKFLH
jgi:hypothetical protein